MVEIILSKDSIASMLISSLEVRPKESIGLVFGHSIADKISCQKSIPVQDANREIDKVSWDMKVEKIIEASQYFIEGFKFLGLFHSHTDSAELSNEDLRLFKENPAYKILILANVTENKTKSNLWCQIGDFFEANINGIKVQFFGFYKNGDGVSKIKIMSPSINIYNILPQEFGVKLHELANLPDEKLEKIHYLLNKIDFDLHELEDGVKTDRRKNNLDYSKQLIKKLLESD